MRYQFQGTPVSAIPPTVSAQAGGALTSAKQGQWYFWLQYRNRAGFSQVSASVGVTIAVGNKLNFTIPLAARPSPNGCDIREFLILANQANDPTNACVIATFLGYETDGSTETTLPGTLEITADEQLELQKSVAAVANLPTTVINGMRRFVIDINQIVEYQERATAWAPVYPQTFVTYVNDITASSGYGADRDFSGISDEAVIWTPNYGLSPSASSRTYSQPIGFWLVNDGTSVVSQGTRIGLSVAIGEEDVSSIAGIVGGIDITFRGYVNATTGVLDQSSATGGTMPNVDTPLPYEGENSTVLTLPKDLPAGSAVVLIVAAGFTVAELNNRIPQGAVLRFSPFFFSNRAIASPPGSLLGSYIAPEGDRRRLVPNLGLSCLALEGTGRIQLASGNAYIFNNVSPQNILGLDPNTANQNVAITINGVCVVVASVGNNAKLRALVGTVDGVGHSTGWSAAIAVDSRHFLTVTLTYPTAIRADYPDLAIAGSMRGTFNATNARFYLKQGGNISYIDLPITPNTSTQAFRVGNSSVTPLGGPIPQPADPYYGLYELKDSDVATVKTAGASVFSSGTVQVAVAFVYSNSVTTINHAAPNAIYEVPYTLAELFTSLVRWRGVWQAATEYQIGDLTSFSNTTYLAIAPSRNQEPPTHATLWLLMGSAPTHVPMPTVVISADGAAAADTRHLVDTSSAGITLTLPNAPPNGTECKFADLAGSWATNALTLTPAAGQSIEHDTSFIANLNKFCFGLVYYGTNWTLS